MNSYLKQFENCVAIVTGASSGIGASICEILIKNGIKVVGFARRIEKLEELSQKLQNQKGKFYFTNVDVTSETEIKKGFEWVAKNVGPPSILVNNAGVISNTNLVQGDTKEWKRIFDTNVIGLCICTREAIALMKAHSINGHIIFMNSVLGHREFYFSNISVYGASKCAITNLTEMYRQELNQDKSKIKITSISPGPVDTEIFTIAGSQFPQPVIDSGAFLKPDDIANAVVYVLSTPPHVQVHELMINPVGFL